MSQRDVERTLGRLLTDAGFRRDFFRNPARACLGLGVQLAAHEVDALLRVPTRRLASSAAQLDDRICRLHVENAIPLPMSIEQKVHVFLACLVTLSAPPRPGARLARTARMRLRPGDHGARFVGCVDREPVQAP